MSLNRITEKEKVELLNLISELKLDFIKNYNEGCKEILGIERGTNGHLIEFELKEIDDKLYDIYMRKLHHGH